MVILIFLGQKLLRLLTKPVAQITKVRKYQPNEMGPIGALALYLVSFCQQLHRIP